MTRQELIEILAVRASLAQSYHRRRGQLGLCDRMHMFQRVRSGSADPDIVSRIWDATAEMIESDEVFNGIETPRDLDRHGPDTLRELLASEQSVFAKAMRRPTMIGIPNVHP